VTAALQTTLSDLAALLAKCGRPEKRQKEEKDERGK
jgi:hypothetical protein